MKVKIIENVCSSYYDVFVFEKGTNGKTRLFIGKTVKEIEEVETTPDPSIRLPREAIMAFLKEAQSLGFEQDIVKESKSLLEMKDYHLQDMRKLVFKGK